MATERTTNLPPILASMLAALTLALSPTPAAAVLPAEVDGKPLPSLAPMLAKTVPGVVNVSTVT